MRTHTESGGVYVMGNDGMYICIELRELARLLPFTSAFSIALAPQGI